ncbi:MAG: rhodanese-like domain-containing protein [Bacteroidales bacterium]
MNKILTRLSGFLFILIAFFSSFQLWGQTQNQIKSVNNDEFLKLMKNKDVVIIDVRTPKEFNEGHIPNAINIDYRSDAFMDRIKKLNKDKILAIYCRSGSRSKSAAKKLIEAGFDVYELNKGIMNWTGDISN